MDDTRHACRRIVRQNTVRWPSHEAFQDLDTEKSNPNEKEGTEKSKANVKLSVGKVKAGGGLNRAPPKLSNGGNGRHFLLHCMYW